MDVFEAMARRRSVRKYSDKPVSDADLDRILTCGGQAPSWVNFQCWEIIVVRDVQTKEQLMETLSKNNPARQAMVAAPVVLVACGRKGESGYHKGQPTTVLGDWLMFDVALFLHNVTLAACALGMGTVHVGSFEHAKAAEILAVPQQVQVVELMPLGYPEGDWPKGPKRKAIQDFLHWEKY